MPRLLCWIYFYLRNALQYDDFERKSGILILMLVFIEHMTLQITGSYIRYINEENLVNSLRIINK